MLLDLGVLLIFIFSWIVMVELELFMFTSLSIGVFLWLLATFDIFNVLTFVKGGLTLAAVKWIALYLLVGVLWSFGKWVFYNYQFRDEYRKVKATFLKIRRVPTLTEELHSDFQAALNHYYEFKMPKKFRGNGLVVDIKNNPPQLSDNKARVTCWVLYWPISIVGTMLNDPFRRLVNFTVERLEAVYQHISNYVFRNE